MAHPMTDAALLSDDEIDDAIDDLRASRCRNDPTARLIARAQPITDELRAIYRAGAARVVGIPQDKLDAERYRWLRDHKGNNRVPHVTQYPYCAAIDDVEYPYFIKVGLDAAIDAAREQPQTDEKR